MSLFKFFQEKFSRDPAGELLYRNRQNGSEIREVDGQYLVYAIRDKKLVVIFRTTRYSQALSVVRMGTYQGRDRNRKRRMR